MQYLGQSYSMQIQRYIQQSCSLMYSVGTEAHGQTQLPLTLHFTPRLHVRAQNPAIHHMLPDVFGLSIRISWRDD